MKIDLNNFTISYIGLDRNILFEEVVNSLPYTVSSKDVLYYILNFEGIKWRFVPESLFNGSVLTKELIALQITKQFWAAIEGIDDALIRLFSCPSVVVNKKGVLIKIGENGEILVNPFADKITDVFELIQVLYQDADKYSKPIEFRSKLKIRWYFARLVRINWKMYYFRKGVSKRVQDALFILDNKLGKIEKGIVDWLKNDVWNNVVRHI